MAGRSIGNKLDPAAGLEGKDGAGPELQGERGGMQPGLGDNLSAPVAREKQ